MCQTMSKTRAVCKIIGNESLTDQIFEMILECPEIVNEAKPGQFVNLYCRHLGRLLPRPISVCELNKGKGYLHLIYAIMGKGTKEFSTYKAGETIDVMGPLGNGYNTDTVSDIHLIVGGGVGIPPMVELCKQLKGKKIIVAGFRDNPYLVNRLKQYGEVHVTTDDGSAGFKGNVVKFLEKKSLKGNIYACGPTPMLIGVQAYAAKFSLDACLSLEERMGCGFGACVGCVAKITSNNDAGFIYKKVCKDGPVFNAKEVLFS